MTITLLNGKKFLDVARMF